MDRILEAIMKCKSMDLNFLDEVLLNIEYATDESVEDLVGGECEFHAVLSHAFEVLIQDFKDRLFDMLYDEFYEEYSQEYIEEWIDGKVKDGYYLNYIDSHLEEPALEEVIKADYTEDIDEIYKRTLKEYKKLFCDENKLECGKE